MGRRGAQKTVFVKDGDRASAHGNAGQNQMYMRNVCINDLTRQHSFSSVYGQKTGGRGKAEEEEPVVIEPNEKGGSFGDQFLATLERSIQQKRRNLMSFALEMIIPLVFVAGTIILWAAFGDEKMPAESELDLAKPTAAVIYNYYTELVCNNESMGIIPGLYNCDIVDYKYSCEGDESTLPLKGLCYNESLTGQGVVGFYLNSLLGNAAAVPPLDTIIIHQWMARKSMSGSAESATTQTLSTSGLTANTRVNAIMSSGNIYFAPAANVPADLVSYINSGSLYFQYVYNGTFETMEEANAHVKESGSLNWAIIEFRALNETDFDVVFHMNSSALPVLTSIVDITYPGGFQYDRGEMYIASGFSSLQKVLYDYYLVTYHSYSAHIPTIHPFLASFGSGAYTKKVLLQTASQLVAFILVLSFLYPVSQLTKQIVLEKELRIREAMLIMGLSNSSLYLSWFVIYSLQYLLECILMVVLLKATYIVSSDAFVLFLIFYLFALTTIPLSGFIASFFSKARLASMLAPLIFFALSVPIFAFTSASGKVILGVSILSPTAFAALLSDVMTLETSIGFSQKSFHFDMLDPQPWLLLVMLGVDFALYYILMFYFDAVLPKDWGTTKHPLFFLIDPFKACARCCCSKAKMEEGTNKDGRAEEGVFEDVDNSEAMVNIVGLRKVYQRGGKKFTAVNNLYWGMKAAEISVLLGHNGAGKSTAMNMMTGMVEPDEGDCYINGYSVCRDLDRVRQQIGFCPQHNILWPELTCREHLEYFGKIKGLAGPTLEDAVRLMLREVDLLEKMDYASKALSGGQKRKLSVAMAFVGRSALVFLDEPTAGMDVGARRYTWELLRRMSESHTIMLTTHYMDEADLLGHRIGIMSKGRLQCSGSSMFLKSRLGVGYNMSISIDPDAEAETIDQLVVALVPSAEASSYNGCEIVYKLPMKDVELFPNLLAGLEQNGEAAGVRGYSLSATTLEEVFLQIALDDMYKDGNAANDAQTAEEIENQNNMVWNCEMLVGGCSRSHSQFRSMMAKRLWNALRDRRMQCFQIVCPVVCILLAMLLTLVKFTRTGSLTLEPSMFGEDIQMQVSNCESLFGTINDTEPRQDSYAYDRYFMNSLNMSWYTIDTDKNHSRPRYTSIFCNDDGLQYTVQGLTTASILFYNTSAYHAGGLVLNQFYNYILQYLTGNFSRVFMTSTSSMPETQGDKSAQSGVQTILIGAIVMIPFTFLPSNPVAWIVKERECKARHLQNVSGLSFYVYWVTNFIFDITAYLVTLVMVMLIFLIFSRKEYVSKESIGPTIVMFIIYGLCSTVAAYCVSFAFNEHSSAQTVTMAVSFVAGFMLVMMVFILSLVDSTKDTSKKLRWAFRVVPSYCVGESIINLAMNRQKIVLGEGESSWAGDVTGWPMIYMAAEFPVFLFLTLFIDHPRRRLWGQSGQYTRGAPAEVIDDEDSDVEDERKAVYEAEKMNINEDVVRVVDLRKVYDNGKVAVRNLSFSILPDEVFGFLGTNGAGKTTAISMLCQEFVPSSGNAYVCGYDIVDQSSEAIQCIGYCPQFDATLDLLTVEEHLHMYAGIRGILYSQRDSVVTGLMRLCDILEYRKTTACELSGGNRRKLSVAMSLIGSPQVVFLDEPSAGMDPVARRGLWTAIQKVSQNCSVVLTTHHLEEVEALADTVAIMADGALRCIGDKIHLKSKYGSGFEMSIRIADKEMRAEVQAFVEANFPDCVLNEFKGQRFVFALPQDTRLSETFWILQQNKEMYGITDYSVSQTSIEQVFLRISEQQEMRTALGQRVVRFTNTHATLHHYKGEQKDQQVETVNEVGGAALEAYRRRRGLDADGKPLDGGNGDQDGSAAVSRRGSARSISKTNGAGENKQKLSKLPSSASIRSAQKSVGDTPSEEGYGEVVPNPLVYHPPVAQMETPPAESPASTRAGGGLSRKTSVRFVAPAEANQPAANNAGGGYDAYGNYVGGAAAAPTSYDAGYGYDTTGQVNDYYGTGNSAGAANGAQGYADTGYGYDTSNAGAADGTTGYVDPYAYNSNENYQQQQQQAQSGYGNDVTAFYPDGNTAYGGYDAYAQPQQPQQSYATGNDAYGGAYYDDSAQQATYNQGAYYDNGNGNDNGYGYGGSDTGSVQTRLSRRTVNSNNGYGY